MTLAQKQFVQGIVLIVSSWSRLPNEFDYMAV
jgi:hypothetical protein